MTKLKGKISRIVALNSKALVIASLAVLVLGAGIAQAAFYRTSGSTGFSYGYGYSSTEPGYGYGYGYLTSELDTNKTATQGFFGSDGKATSVSASAAQTSFTVSYTTSYYAQDRINYGSTSSYGSNSSETSFETGSNSIQVTSLSCNTTYHYRVESTDKGGNVWHSADATVTTASCSGSGGGSSSGGGGGGGGGGVLITTQATTTQTTTPATTTDTSTTVYPSGLTGSQIDSIIDVLTAFGVDDTTIAEIRAELMGTSTGGTSSSTSAYVFTRDLELGSTSADVLELQKYLNTHGFVVAATGVGSAGHETTYFGQLTKNALIKYQKAHSITPAVGYFGPITRASVNAGK